jgi:hypothetical protein
MWWSLRARWPALAGSVLGRVVAASVDLGVDTTVCSITAGIASGLAGRLPRGGYQRVILGDRGGDARAEWLASNAPPRDVVATNVHCEQVRTTDTCVSRSFWVSSLTEHAVVLEGWAYQDAVMARHGVNGLRHFRQPAPDLALQRANDPAFTAPTTTGLATLRDECGARWLFADNRPGLSLPTVRAGRLRLPVRPPVTICRLRD